MRLTQEEAKKWAEILKGFSEGKWYQIPCYRLFYKKLSKECTREIKFSYQLVNHI